MVYIEISLAPNAPRELLGSAQAAARLVSTTAAPNPDIVSQTIRRMQDAEDARKAQQLPPRGAAPHADQSRFSIAGPPITAAAVPVQPSAGRGELEVAMSANAKTVIVASNAQLSFSTNGGATYAFGATGVFGLNDPSLARGVSGNFYLAVIATPTGQTTQLGVDGCTNAVSRSTDNGATFTLQGYSAQCPRTGTGICFPDQEHLVGDVNTSGADQLYAV